MILSSVVVLQMIWEKILSKADQKCVETPKRLITCGVSGSTGGEKY